MTHSIYLNLQEVWELRRAAARYPERWVAAGSDILDINRHPIGRMSDKGATALIVQTHNLLLPIINTLHMALMKLEDRRVMKREIDENPPTGH